LHIENLTDDILIQNIVAGDTGAIEKLLIKYMQGIFAISYRLCEDIDDANDITQEVCIKIMKHIKSFKGESELKTWIYRIAYNETLQFLRTKKEYIELDTIASSLGENDTYEIDSTDAKKIVQRSIDTLSPLDKSIILFYYYDELKIREIADIMKINENTVKTRLSRAKLALQPLLETL
jgi:RNA polymerase sigma-70 factor (ECF subfamily)